MDFSDWKKISTKNRFLFGAMLFHFFYCIPLLVYSIDAIAYFGMFDLMFVGMMIDQKSGFIKKKQYSGIASFYSIQLLLVVTLMVNALNYSFINFINLALILSVVGISVAMHLRNKNVSK